MNELFNKYVSKERFRDALLVGRNLVNRNPGNREYFKEYFHLLIKLADELPMFSERESYLNQAGVALAFFEENVVLDEEMMGKLSDDHSKLDESIKTLRADIKQSEEEDREANFKKTDQLLKDLFRSKDRILQATTQERLNQILTEVATVDQQIDHSLFNKEQTGVYNELNQTMTDLISKKMREFEHKNNIVYNQKAADNFARAFSEFKANEDQYKSDLSKLYELTSHFLFGFDAARLFNETLVYYNHVYSYIFGKLNDDGKLALTRYSIECEKNLR